jgi:predicted small metal-binding protein
MAKTFECKHGGVVCGAKIRGQTEGEVLAKAVAHAKEAHGVDLSASKTLTSYAKSLIRDE